MSTLRVLYLGLAIWGAARPLYGVFFDQAGGLPGWLGPWSVLSPGTPQANDLLVALLALSLWIFAETWVRRNWIAIVAIPVAWAVGLGCGLPLYLFLRTRQVA